ncbi:MAG: hypothetical protein HDR71_03900 [Lachnospiraceae bacterium]|nr:hypothetical protein [Lachnospiraceae bacterium]
MKTFIKKAGEILIEHRIFFAMMLILASFVYIIRDDYVVMDAFKEQGEDYFFVTKESPLYVDIAPTGDGLNSIFFNMRYPSEALEEFVTTVSLSENETVFYLQTFKNDSIFEIGSQFGQAVEFNFDVIDTRPDAEYRLTITSNASNESNAFGFCKDTENNLWYRLSYLLLSKGQRKWTSFFFVFFFSTIMYLLIQKFKCESMFGGGYETAL